ncbi:ADP-ribosylglycohydrolase family protein [Sphaerospermopsis aphanizomenoides BCCUSP55]|uniref:ADP-ribosylglycohydrolase family protein n=1 Tax=Sphaerospermopsis aphanizomenoides TaxID=459663 RepID=UPI0019053827|nr:ADP-ribosylglycohydrolase family protein [Sphaerospermopsis aphanizomenoides]MBK1987473.1 ADP-ribosylglycohydrolase family protein [Sphaerospermopsis aphanizomenoides BCCUSP55]
MRYSLVSRVRGIFLGALIGENLATPNDGDLGKMAVLGSQSLIALGKLDVDDWLKRYQKAAIDLEQTNTNWERIILATLPVAVFFHEDTIKLKQNLLQVLQIWDTDPMVTDAALVIGYAIAQSLTETLDPLTFIPQTISFLEKTTTPIPQNLLKVDKLLAQGAGLQQVQNELIKQKELCSHITLAVYCFLSSLEDFRLTLLRVSANFSEQESGSLGLQTRSALAGALSGAYNSTTGIPVNWQVLFSANNSPIWKQNSFFQMLELADQLVAVWSGLYNLTSNTKELTEVGCGMNGDTLSVYTAPSVIRPR